MNPLADARDRARKLLAEQQAGRQSAAAPPVSSKKAPTAAIAVEPKARPTQVAVSIEPLTRRPAEPPPVEDGGGLTFGDLAETFLEKYSKVRKRSWKDDARNIRVDLLPAWKDRPVETIRRRDVAELLDGVVERGAPILANRIKALVSKIFNYGIGRGMTEVNPAMGVPMPSKPRQRDRVLSEDEIRALWRVFDTEGLVMGVSFRMRLLTAQRGAEVMSMKWDQIRDGWWTIPAETAKNGRAHRVPLSSQARSILGRLCPITGESPWVFESPRVPGSPIVEIAKAAKRFSQLSGVDYVPHDLRRTAATFMTSMGISRLVVSKILNHVESGVTAIYDRHSYDAEKLDALEKWGQRLERIVQVRPT